MPFINKFIDLETGDEINRIRNNYLREKIAEFSFNAPFWLDGGLLYIHQFLPHPDGGLGKFRSLSENYSTNVDLTRDFLYLINKKLEEKFLNNYVIIITSDHPLRAKMWCSNTIYYTPECIMENFTGDELVPFIVFAPKHVQIQMPVNNVGLFSPLSKIAD